MITKNVYLIFIFTYLNLGFTIRLHFAFSTTNNTTYNAIPTTATITRPITTKKYIHTYV